MQDILLLHGAVGSKDQLVPLSEKLKQQYNVHLLSFSGHGGNPLPGQSFSIPLFAEDVYNYVVQNKLQQVNIFGYSMGGYVAMYLALRHPQLVNKIITLGTKFHWDESVASKEVKLLDPDTISSKVPAFADLLKQRHHPEDWKLVLAATKQMLLDLGNNNCLQLQDYAQVHNPCLILLGGNDKMISLEETISVANALPNARFDLLPSTPHPIEQVDLDLLVPLINDFINH